MRHPSSAAKVLGLVLSLPACPTPAESPTNGSLEPPNSACVTATPNASSKVATNLHVYPSAEFGQQAAQYDVVFANVLWRNWPACVKPNPDPTKPCLSLDDTLNEIGAERKLAIRFQALDFGCAAEKPTDVGVKFLGSKLANEECKAAAEQTEFWSPDWKDGATREAHRKALTGLGDWVAKNHKRVAWVELGSFGRWGEWHYHGTALQQHFSPADFTAIAADYLCAFPSTPLSISFDALKDPGVIAALMPLLRSKGVGIYFDSLGALGRGGVPSHNTDFLTTIRRLGPTVAQDFNGPWSLEFQGDDCGRNDSFGVLNSSTPDEWATTSGIVANYPFLHFRQGGENLLVEPHYLTDTGIQRLNELAGTFDSAERNKERSARLMWRTESSRCAACSEDAKEGCVARVKQLEAAGI